MRKGKKVIGILGLVIVTVCTAMFVSAAEVDPYQAVIDKLNKEYSMDIHFMSATEARTYLISAERDIDITPEEFEQKLREEIIENNRAKAEADKKFAELETEVINESGDGFCDPAGEPVTRTKVTVTRNKQIAGATAYLTATVSDSPGYWMYSDISAAYTKYVAGVNSTPAFCAETYNYSLIDARRTCALKLYGYTLGSYGTILDPNAYRYVEFWAGSGM